MSISFFILFFWFWLCNSLSQDLFGGVSVGFYWLFFSSNVRIIFSFHFLFLTLFSPLQGLLWWCTLGRPLHNFHLKQIWHVVSLSWLDLLVLSSVSWLFPLWPGSLGIGRAFTVLQFKDNTSVKSYLPGFLAQAGCFPVAILLIFSRVGPIHLVLGVERLGWWGGVKATIQLPPLPLLEVIVSAIAPLAN